MTHTRRLTLQLTPLLDLLLIVMFAQYMEMRIIAARDEERSAVEKQATVAENESLRQQVEQWESAQRETDRKRGREIEQVGQLVRELFRVPETVVNKLIQPRSQTEAGGFSPADIADLKARFQQLATAQGAQIVDHLLEFNEMRKQFDIWEIYLNEKGELFIKAGQDGQMVKTKVIEAPEAFVEAIMQVRRRFPPTKNTVLMLCRYGDCRLQNRLAMTRGLPAVGDRIRNDGQGSTRFEYAVFGYRPQPDLDQ